MIVTVLVAGAGLGLLPDFTGNSASSAEASSDAAFATLTQARLTEVTPAPATVTPKPVSTELPADSGTGKRVVFSQSDQRVWLVDANGVAETTYLVSGSIHDNLNPGTFRVYSRSERATSFNYTSTMRYFVRFAHGPNAAIGFHDIPLDRSGNLEQTTAQLGTPLSSGCIRQERPNAIKLWNFAPVGTKVVVLA
ncbi:MAG: hypothetical protein JWP10_1070 [Nocardioidaceae bacterium]|nr:hypothetical protein [Nocardioidaceae bacterium]